MPSISSKIHIITSFNNRPDAISILKFTPLADFKEDGISYRKWLESHIRQNTRYICDELARIAFKLLDGEDVYLISDIKSNHGEIIKDIIMKEINNL